MVQQASVTPASTKTRRLDEETILNDTQTAVIGGVIGGWVTYVVIYIVLNIVGTIYFTKVINFPKSFLETNAMKGGQITALILGWVGIPIVNLCAPITWIVHHKDF